MPSQSSPKQTGRFVIDEPAFRALVRGRPLAIGSDEVIIIPTLGWRAMIQACLDAISAGIPEQSALRLNPVPPDPPEAREFLPGPRRRRE